MANVGNRNSLALGPQILELEISWPRRGAWLAELAVDATEPLSGAVTIDVEGQLWQGTVLRAAANHSRGGVQIIGGAGGIHKALSPKHYVGPAYRQMPTSVQASTVLGDILTETGETLSPTTDRALLETRFLSWQRTAGPASKALTKLVEKLGASWRILRDGTLWVGVDTYPEQTFDHTIIRENLQTGSTVIAYEGTEQPLLEPGVTFRGRRIEQVVHTIGRTLRTEALETTPSAALDQFNEDIYLEIDYSRPYPARVVTQHGDGTIDVMPADALFKGTGVSHVPIWLGVPGSVELPKGQRVMLEYEAGDPSRPVVRCFELSAVTVLKLGNAQQYVALANLVDALFQGQHERLRTHTHSSGMGPTGPAIEGPQWPEPESVACTKVQAE